VHHAGPCAGSEYVNLLLSVSSFSRVFLLSPSLSLAVSSLQEKFRRMSGIMFLSFSVFVFLSFGQL
jgi:hypothetical protein